MDVVETLRAHQHTLGPFADTIIDELQETLRDTTQQFTVLVPTHQGIQALDEASFGASNHTHDASDHVATDGQTLSGHSIVFETYGFDTLCNGVKVHCDSTRPPIEATNGLIYIIDRPLQFYS